jgi:hypothetical protein
MPQVFPRVFIVDVSWTEVNTCSDEIGVIAKRSFFCYCESRFIGTKQSHNMRLDTGLDDNII